MGVKSRSIFAIRLSFDKMSVSLWYRKAKKNEKIKVDKKTIYRMDWGEMDGSK